MSLVLQTLLVVAAATTVVAGPTPRGPRSFTAHQGVTKKSAPGALAVANTYAKYGAPVPANVAEAARILLDGTGIATPEIYDEEYLVPVVIGGETLNLDFDTGSSDLWVFSSEQPTSQRTGHAYYTPSATSTLLSGYTWDISYGDGSSASGNVYTDMVSVGTTDVTGQAVELAKTVSSEFSEDTANDGLMGLAFEVLNTVTPTKQKTFLINAIDEGLLEEPLFTADLMYHAPGTYDFGFIDSTKYTGAISYTPVTKEEYWEITGSGYAVGTGAFVSTSIDAIIDTGTTLLYMSDAVNKAYYAKVTGAKNSATYGGYVFPCTSVLPSLTVGIGSLHAVIPGTYLNYAPVATGSTTCFGGLQSDDGIGFAIYGDVFIKAVFVVFDYGNLRVGVAEKTLAT